MLTTFIYTWHLDDEGIIHGFGLNADNKTVHLEINSFTPYIYMELPDNIDWNEPRKQSILSVISDFPDEMQPVIKSFMKKKKLYDANVVKTNGEYVYKTYPYLFVAFANKVTLSNFMKKMSYGVYIPAIGKQYRFKFHEHLATPILQFTCLRKIPMTGWVSYKGKRVLQQPTSSCDFEYEVKWSDVSPCQDEAILKSVVCPTILMFDCEANSDNISTMPKNRPNDKIFQISFAVTRHGSGVVVKHLLSLGELDQNAVGEDAILHCYRTEGDLLVGFSELIREIDPQVIGGYNILGWDFEYLIKRAKLNGVFSEFSKFGYLEGVQSKEKNISWSSSAFNAQNFTFLDAAGRVIIDMLPLVRRDFKFSRYDLGSVSTEILGNTKDPLTHKGIFKCYRIFSKASLSLVAKYCIQDSVITLQLFDKLKTWIGSCQMSEIFGVSMIDLYTQGQQLKIYSQVYRECIDKNIVVEHDAFQCGEDESYTGAIVLEPEAGMYKDVVTFDFASLYPSVMMSNNICYSTRVLDPTIPDEDCHIFDFWDHLGCIVKGQAVALRHNSINIENLTENTFVSTFGETGIIQGKQTAFYNQGIKKCIKITLFDGTQLSCTPDHRILTDSGWKEAKDLILNVDKIKVGVSPPTVNVIEELNDSYSFTVGEHTYTMNTVEQYDKSLIISRLVGLILSDGSICKTGTNIYSGTQIDVDEIVNDIKLLANCHVPVRREKYVWKIHIPQIIVRHIWKTDGIVNGKRSTQIQSLPTFLISAPKCIIREFLGGLFGGDGHTLSYGKSSKCFGHISISMTSIEEHIDSLYNYMEQIRTFLSMFDISCSIHHHYDSRTNGYEVKLTIFAKDTIKFYEQIGFRYCAHKSVRLMVGSSYYKYRDNINRQRMWVVENIKNRSSDMTVEQAVPLAHSELKSKEYIFNEHYSLPNKSAIYRLMSPDYKGEKTSFQTKYLVPTVEEYIKMVGADLLFHDSYAVKQYSDEIPVISIPVVHRIDIGYHQTYDIQVDKTHSFLCNGIVVHNCNHDTTVRTVKVKKIICAHRKYRFLKSPMGILPTLLKNLITNRKIAKKEGESEEERAKSITDPDQKKAVLMYAMVCDMKQLALKVSCNSMYGGMGVRKGKLPFMPGAMSTTAGGRDALMKAKRLITEKYPGKTVYGDSDSLMYIFDCMDKFRNSEGQTDYKQLEEYACMVADDISQSFPAPMKLEYENTAEDFFILTKKRYMTKLTTGKYKKRGIMITRRDNALACRNVYEGMLKCIFAYKTQSETEMFIIESLNAIYSHSQPTKEYSITKSIKEIEDYKIKYPDKEPEKRRKQFLNKFLDSTRHSEADYLVRCLPAHVQLAEKMRRRGMFVEAGSRLEYVVTTNGGVKGKIWQKIEASEYYKEHSSIIYLDMNYYCKSLVNPGDQALKTMYQLENFFKEQLEYRLLKTQCLEELRNAFTRVVVVKEN